MVPIDDPSWPVCPALPDLSCPNWAGNGNGWCGHVRQFLIGGSDGSDLTPGGDYCVPVVPTMGLFAKVNLGTTLIVPEPKMVQMSLVKPAESPFLTDPEDFIALGLHTEGEGRFTIALAVKDWVRSKLTSESRCEWHTHSIQQERAIQVGLNNEQYMEAHRWCLAYYDKCFECYQSGNNLPFSGTVTDQSGLRTWSASSFGIGDVTAPRSDAENAAKEALRNRFNRA